ncbi:unnamed protein product, partial [Rotaria magnacalcarata]
MFYIDLFDLSNWILGVDGTDITSSSISKSHLGKNIPPPMLPYPHHFVTPDNIEVDFRLHNHDLQAKLQSIVSSLISTSIPKHWFATTKRRLINQYK